MLISACRSIAAELSKNARDLLIEHVDGKLFVDVPTSIREGRMARSALLDRHLIRFANYGPRPNATRITEDGRMVLCAILADYAEALIRAGFVLEAQGTPAIAEDARRYAAAIHPLSKDDENAGVSAS